MVCRGRVCDDDCESEVIWRAMFCSIQGTKRIRGEGRWSGKAYSDVRKSSLAQDTRCCWNGTRCLFILILLFDTARVLKNAWDQCEYESLRTDGWVSNDQWVQSNLHTGRG